MTRAEILDCLTDRPCDFCKFHESGRCERWECVFEEEPDECEDAISRHDAIHLADELKDDLPDDEQIADIVTAHNEGVLEYQTKLSLLPPVTTKQKVGHWKVASDGYGDNAYICECSECKDTVWVYKDADRKWNYCPNCGAKMAESEDTE